MDIAKPTKKFALVPCGVDLSELQLTSKIEARKKMHLKQHKHYVLFSGAFDNAVKNATLAKEAVAGIEDANVELLELKGYSREEVSLMMCAADALLLTSINEGSPQVIKEALACGCPIVSVDVGDVQERIEGLEGCFVAHTWEPKDLVKLLCDALRFEGRTHGLNRVIDDGLDNKHVADRILKIYSRVIQK